MTEKYLQTAPHEGDLHLIFDEFGLDPYYAMDSIRKDWDRWETDGKPTANIDLFGNSWAVAYDYDTDNPLDVWVHESYQLQTVPEFRFYFVAKDGLYDGEPADQSKRVRGGTITVRPRWPDLTANDGEPVRGVPNLGGPYIDCQIQASNIRHERYEKVLKSVVGAFGVSSHYFANPHDISNWQDMAVYVRVDRNASGPVHAADGPIARTHQLFESDREGYREHKSDNRKLPGYYVSTKITDDRAREIVRGHTLGKEIKHYYPQNPEHFEPGDALYHPKVEVSYQTSISDETLYYEGTSDAVRELEEMLLNTLDWAELPLAGGDPYVDDEYFDATDGDRRSRRIVDCPLPEIEDAQTAAVMRLWGDSNDSDQAVIEHLLTDGGTVSPSDAADKTGYSYRTIRDVMDRCGEVLRHTYNQVEIASEHQKNLLLERVRATEENFRNAVEDAALTAADAVNDVALSKWSRTRRRYNVRVENDPANCRKKLVVGYTADDLNEARNIVQSLKTAYTQAHDDRGGAHGVHAVVTVTGIGKKRYKNLETHTIAPSRDSQKAKSHREKVEQVDWEAHGYPDVTGG